MLRIGSVVAVEELLCSKVPWCMCSGVGRGNRGQHVVLQSYQDRLGMAAHVFHSSTLEAEADGFLYKGSLVDTVSSTPGKAT